MLAYTNYKSGSKWKGLNEVLKHHIKAHINVLKETQSFFDPKTMFLMRLLFLRGF